MVTTKKIVIVGDGACGKTCLAVVFSKNEFPEVHIPTIYDNYIKTVTVDGTNVELSIWDTAGEEDYDRLRPLSYSKADLMLVCFSIDNPNSLTNVVHKWVPELRHHCRKVPIILVGNKLDLRSNVDVIEYLQKRNQYPVRIEEAVKVSKKIKASAYFECSAKFVIGVNDLFREVARLTLQPPKNNFKSCVPKLNLC